MTPTNCPSCKAQTPNEYASKCDACGYVFAGAQMSEMAVLGAIDRNVRTIRNAVMFWVIFTLVIAALLWIIRMWS